MLVYVAVVKVQTAVSCSVSVDNFLDRRRRQNNITFIELIGWTKHTYTTVHTHNKS